MDPFHRHPASMPQPQMNPSPPLPALRVLQDSAPAMSEADDAEGTPRAWTLYYLAQHYDHLGQTGRALETIELCIHDYPSVLEGYTAKAKILKHAGDLEAAAAAADRARTMDKADRCCLFLDACLGSLLGTSAMYWGPGKLSAAGAPATAPDQACNNSPNSAKVLIFCVGGNLCGSVRNFKILWQSMQF